MCWMRWTTRGRSSSRRAVQSIQPAAADTTIRWVDAMWRAGVNPIDRHATLSQSNVLCVWDAWIGWAKPRSPR